MTRPPFPHRALGIPEAVFEPLQPRAPRSAPKPVPARELPTPALPSDPDETVTLTDSAARLRMPPATLRERAIGVGFGRLLFAEGGHLAMTVATHRALAERLHRVP